MVCVFDDLFVIRHNVLIFIIFSLQSVTIWISPCHDLSSVPLIDSIEIYARARDDLAFLKTISFSSGDYGVTKDIPLQSTKHFCVQEQGVKVILVSCIQSLRFLTEMLGNSNMGSLSSGSRDVIKHIIEQTALDTCEKGSLRDQTILFLSEVERDEVKRAFFIDEATLRGSICVLQGLGKFILAEFSSVNSISSKHETMICRALQILDLILDSTIAIARTRRGNYRKAILTIIAEKVSRSSIAIEGKKILDFCTYLKSLHGVNTLNLVKPTQLVSELILMEIAVSDLNEFAQFDALAEYLMCADSEIVKACCTAITNALGGEENKASPDRTELSCQDHFVTYQCDSCKIFPITGKRYTLGGEDDIDLCTNCFEMGVDYARSHHHKDPLVIQGHTLCIENEEMTCEMIWQMTCKSIAASSLEQAEEVLRATEAKKAGLLENMDDVALEAALKISMENHNEDGSIGVVQASTTEGFKSLVFTKLLGLISNSLLASEEITQPSSCNSLQLLVE